MVIIILFFFILIFFQIVLGLISIKLFNDAKIRFSVPTVSKKNIHDILEIYNKEYPNLEMKIDRYIDEPFFGEKNKILIRQDFLQNNSLWCLIYLLWELEKTKDNNSFIRKSPKLLNILFFMEFLPLTLLFIDNSTLHLISLFLVILIIVLIFIIVVITILKTNEIKNMIEIIAENFLEFDELDISRTNKIIFFFKIKILDYPLDILIKIKNLIS